MHKQIKQRSATPTAFFRNSRILESLRLTIPDCPAKDEKQEGCMRCVRIPEDLAHSKSRCRKGDVKTHVSQRLQQIAAVIFQYQAKQTGPKLAMDCVLA